MEFEFDEKKSQINAEKHGIDFEEAQFLWCDERRLVVEARSETESRYALIAFHSGSLWTAIYTVREEHGGCFYGFIGLNILRIILLDIFKRTAVPLIQIAGK